MQHFGTTELPLTGFSHPNTKYKMAGFSVGLKEGINLVGKNQIPAISPNEQDANTNFGLTLRTSRNGWKTTGELNYYTKDRW